MGSTSLLFLCIFATIFSALVLDGVSGSRTGSDNRSVGMRNLGSRNGGMIRQGQGSSGTRLIRPIKRCKRSLVRGHRSKRGIYPVRDYGSKNTGEYTYFRAAFNLLDRRGITNGLEAEFEAAIKKGIQATGKKNYKGRIDWSNLTKLGIPKTSKDTYKDATEKVFSKIQDLERIASEPGNENEQLIKDLKNLAGLKKHVRWQRSSSANAHGGADAAHQTVKNKWC